MDHNCLALTHALFSVCLCGSPCLNGGNCYVDAANTPVCTCSYPYTGTFCEKGQCSMNKTFHLSGYSNTVDTVSMDQKDTGHIHTMHILKI